MYKVSRGHYDEGKVKKIDEICELIVNDIRFSQYSATVLKLLLHW